MLGVDFGSSYTDAVALGKGRVEKKISIPSSLNSFSSLFFKKIAPLANGQATGLTGGWMRSEAKKLFQSQGLRCEEVSEIRAIALGAKFLSKQRKFLCANVGTGTPFVFVDGRKFEHLGGTGVGGGTLEGLGKLLLKEKVGRLGPLALKGRNSLDLTVFDVLKSSIGKIPANATASNFGNAGKTRFKKEAAASSIASLVGETIGVMASFAASAKDCNSIVFTGRVPARNASIRKKLSETTRLFRKKAFFPSDCEYCTAIGAALAVE